jgi:hypothetical protein
MFSRLPRAARFPPCLFLTVLTIGLFLLIIQVALRINLWWQLGTRYLWQWEATHEVINSPARGLSQFVNILRGTEDLFSREVVLNLDPDLLLTSSARPWYLELNIDGEWQKLGNFGGFSDLLSATPLVWRNKLVYRVADQAIYSYDLNVLVEDLLLDKETAAAFVAQALPERRWQIPLSELELVGQMNEQIFVYYHNVLDEGVMFRTDGRRSEDDRLIWEIDSDIKGKIVNIASYNLLLQGNNSGESWSFYQLKEASNSATPTWQRLVEVTDGSLPGKRFIGVDENNRLILADAVSSRGANQLILGDNELRFQEITALSLATGQEVRLQGAAELPASVYQVALIPSSYNLVAQYLGANEEQNASDSAVLLAALEQFGEFLALVTAQSVYKMNLTTGALYRVGSLDGLFDYAQLRRVLPESWCFEASRDWVGMNLTTGVALSGSSYCQTDTADSRSPYIDKLLPRLDKEKALLTTLSLPLDLRLTNGETASPSIADTYVAPAAPSRSAGVLNDLFF